MLIKPTREEGETYIDFAYKLALDQSKSSYPTYADGIKTKEDFADQCIRGLTRDGQCVLLYLENDAVSGWIQFFYEKENHYLQTVIFNIAGDFQRALAEFIEYCDAQFAGYELYLGFPADNLAAIGYLTENGWSRDDQSYNNVLFFEDYEPRPETAGVIKVTQENFSDFRKLHERVQGDMYWNADRLYDAMDEWYIYLYCENTEPAAAIYCRDCGILMEIFGVDFKNGRYHREAFRALLAKILNECKQRGKKNMCFFGDDENQRDILDMGFHCVGEYVLFVKKIKKGSSLCV